MISYEIVEHGKPLQKAVRETPRPQGTEVLMRVTRSGVCHSDVHIWEGYFDLGGGKRFYVKERGCVPPFIMGHEPFGVGRAGAYATHLLVPHPKYLVDAGGIDESFAATLACSAVTAYSATKKLPKLGPKDWVAVIGCGGLGLIGVSVLRTQGVKNIVACDIDPSKLAAAAKLGAKKTLETGGADAVQRLQAAAAHHLACAIDFVGMPAPAALGMGAIKKGGRYVICGLMGGELVYSLPMLVQRAMTVVGSHVGNLQELKEVVALAKKGKLKPAPVETRPASQAARAIGDLKAGKVTGRVVLDFEAVAA